MALSALPLDQIPLGAVITLDAAPIIYFLQDHPIFAPLFAPIFEMADRGDLGIVISAVTLAEMLTGPLQAKDEVLTARYRKTLTVLQAGSCGLLTRRWQRPQHVSGQSTNSEPRMRSKW